MIPLQNTKSYQIVVPASATTGATNVGTVDTLGYDYAIIDAVQGTETTAASVLKVTEGASTSDVTTAIAAFTNGTGFTMPATNATTGPIVRFNIDLRKRERYLQLNFTTGITTITSGHCLLGRAEQTPSASASVDVTG
jgi:hypothetical protein